MYTHMYRAECAAALSSAYAYTYVPSRYTCIHIYVFTQAIASFPKTPFFPTEEKGNAQGFH